MNNFANKGFLISLAAIFVQYYDYHLYGFLAANIASYCFPEYDTTTQLLGVYLLMSLSMFAKPVGAVIIGKIGDIDGRSHAIKVSVIGSLLASIVIFAVPSYESIGLFSVFALLIYRMIICACVASGSDGVRIYIYEYVDSTNKSLSLGITNFFTLSGTLVASISAWFFTLDILPDYSWKYAFLIGCIMSIIILIIMRIIRFSDEQMIQGNQNNNESVALDNLSITQIIQLNWKLFILCSIAIGCIGSTNQFLMIFFGTYAFEILQIIDRSSMQLCVSLGIALYMVLSIVSGYLSDRVNTYYVIFVAAILVLVLSIILSITLYHTNISCIIFVFIISIMPFITIGSAVVIKQSIPRPIRYRIFAISHAIGSLAISAPTSFICILLYDLMNLYWIPILYFMITIIAIILVLYHLLHANDIQDAQ